MEVCQFTIITAQQKLNAMAVKYYYGLKWSPKKGDYYTSARDDNELYRIVKIENGIVFTQYCDKGGDLAQWPESEFTTEGFGLQRVYVNREILMNT